MDVSSIWTLIGCALTVAGYASVFLGLALGGWFAWNFGGFLRRPHRHGDGHWGVVAAVFYATPPVVLLVVGAVLILLSRLI
jgi:hypothetical protein